MKQVTVHVDPVFQEPYIDTDEWRDLPVRHRYLHGGFRDNETRFSFYLPPAERYEGRFFQHITPVPSSENLAQLASGQEDKIGFALSSGAFFVETNGGGQSFGEPGSSVDPSIAAYRANAAVAGFARQTAGEMYGSHRTYGYAYGGSGGAFRTIAGAENTAEVWDGFVPYVVGSPMAVPNVFSVRMHAQRVLADQLDLVADVFEPGGDPDALDVLSDEQRAALCEVTRMGFPPRSWFAHRTMGTQAFSVLYPHLVAMDPGYFTDFWTEPGYLGSDPTSSIHQDRVTLRTGVKAVISRARAIELGLLADASPEAAQGGVDHAFTRRDADAAAVVAVQLTDTPARAVHGAVLSVQSGQASGAARPVASVRGDIALFDEELHPTSLTALRPGDEIELDNSNFLAAQTYHRHQVPDPEFTAWDQFRGPDGEPLFPQRPVLAGPIFATAAAGSLQTGRVTGKMIVVACLLDREAFPWQADWYRRKVEQHLGADAHDQFRLWYVDNALHADEERQEFPTHTVSYLGVLHRALRDLATWVETGRPAPESTQYELSDGQVVVPEDATTRAGVQPVVDVTVDGRTSAHVLVGQPVQVRAVVATPVTGDVVVILDWDLDGDGEYEHTDAIGLPDAVDRTRTTSFETPGTYFVACRASVTSDGSSSAFGRMDNLGRARVVVR